MTDHDRFHRNKLLFGAEGQQKLQAASVCVVGAGGLGTHVLQQLALLGVGELTAIDDEELSESNKNRYVTAYANDPVPGTAKTEIARRLVNRIDPAIKFCAVQDTLLSAAAFLAIKRADYVLGCLDGDGPRFVLNDVTTAFGKPYLDLASDIVDGSFGGRVVTNWHGDGCLYCMDELDMDAVADYLESDDECANRQTIYGIDKAALQLAGPSVVSINGTVASIAITEFMLACTQLRKPFKFINYDGQRCRTNPREVKPKQGCVYCGQWGRGDEADVDRYLRFAEKKNKGK